MKIYTAKMSIATAEKEMEELSLIGDPEEYLTTSLELLFEHIQNSLNQELILTLPCLYNEDDELVFNEVKVNVVGLAKTPESDVVFLTSGGFAVRMVISD